MNTFNQFGQPVGEPLIDWQPVSTLPGGPSGPLLLA